MAEARQRTISALAQLLRDSGTPNPDAVALEVIAVLAGRGWHFIDRQPAPAGHPAPPNEEFRARKAAIQRHADHGPDVTCRPAGHGLCEPQDGQQLQPWRDAITP